MKKNSIILLLCLATTSLNAQLIDLKNLDLSKLVSKAMTVKQGWAPKFSFGNLDISKVAKVGQIINLKNIGTATKLFNTFKTGRTIYKAGAYIGMATSLYSSIKNISTSSKLDKATLQAEIDKYKSQLKGAQTTLIAGGATILTGVIIKFLTKQAASKAADAFNGVVRKKLQDILSFDAPTPSQFTIAGVALKIKL